MRLAVLTSTVSRNAGGLFQSVRSLHRNLAQDVSTRVMSLRDEFTAADLPVWAPLTVDVFDSIGPKSLGYSPSLNKALRNYAPDAVHVHGLWQGQSVASLRQHAHSGAPHVISPRGMLDPWALANSRWKKRIASAAYESAHLRGASCLHALCQSEANAIRAYGLRNPIAVIPNGVDLPGETEERFASRQKTENRRKILLFLGRIHPKKGLVNALRAWSSHLQSTIHEPRSSEWIFAIAGWDQGGHEAELKRLCDELGLEWADATNVEHRNERKGDLLAQQSHQGPRGNSATVIDTPLHTSCLQSMIVDHPSVLFLGPAFGDAKDQLLSQADAFILPSFSEGLPMAVLEAWAYGLPVLMTEHCNLPEGFAADAAIRIGTDSETIAEGMRLLFRSPVSDLQSLGRNGRALVERQFTWPQVAAQMKEVYEWVLGGGPRPDCVRD